MIFNISNSKKSYREFSEKPLDTRYIVIDGKTYIPCFQGSAGSEYQSGNWFYRLGSGLLIDNAYRPTEQRYYLTTRTGTISCTISGTAKHQEHKDIYESKYIKVGTRTVDDYDWRDVKVGTRQETVTETVTGSQYPQYMTVTGTGEDHQVVWYPNGVRFTSPATAIIASPEPITDTRTYYAYTYWDELVAYSGTSFFYGWGVFGLADGSYTFVKIPAGMVINLAIVGDVKYEYTHTKTVDVYERQYVKVGSHEEDVYDWRDVYVRTDYWYVGDTEYNKSGRAYGSVSFDLTYFSNPTISANVNTYDLTTSNVNFYKDLTATVTWPETKTVYYNYNLSIKGIA